VPDSRVLTGAAGLGYVVAAAIENMGALEAPPAGAGAARIRDAYADHALQLVTWLAGATSLVFYCAFALGLCRIAAGSVRASAGGRARLAAPRVALGGALLAAALAAAALAAASALVADSDGIAGDRVESLFAFFDGARLAAGAFMAVFLFGTAAAALRSGALPRVLAVAAYAIAPALLFGPLTAATGGDGVRVAAFVAFGLHSLWIACVGLWLALGRDTSPAELVRRAAFLVLALAAGLVGAALIAVPGATGRFFAWELAPPPLAAFAGGVYVGSAAVYAAALRAPWREVRGLVVAAAVLSSSVFAITLAHLDVFDFGRLQAWAWIVLFALFSAIMAMLAARRSHDQRPGAPPPPAARALLAAVAALLAPLAAALWLDPGSLSGASPIDLPPLGGRFAGSWIAMLAVLAGWAALRNTREEARYPALALVALPLGALAAAPHLAAGSAAPYAAGLLLLGAAGAAVLASLEPAARRVAIRA